MSNAADGAGAGEIVITIQSLRAINDGASVAMRLLLDNGEQREEKRLVIGTEQYCDLKPRCGRISLDLYEQLEAAAELCTAMQCGMRLLAYGANTEAFLSKKLMRRGYSRSVSAEAAAQLKEKGLIDEDSTLRREVEKCLRKLWGAGRIRAHLYSRGFDPSAMKQLGALLDEIDFSDACVRLIRKRYVSLPEDGEERRRLIAFLGRYGYSIGEIRAAFARIQSGQL